MKRVFISRVVIHAECLGAQDAEAFRLALEKSVEAALNGQRQDIPAPRVAHLIDAGRVDPAGSELAHAVALRIAASLGGKP